MSSDYLKKTPRELWLDIFGEHIVNEIFGEPLESSEEIEDNNSMSNNNTFNIYDAVTTTIADLIFCKVPFTAWDITREVRQSNPSENIPHDDIKSIVHTTFLSGAMGTDYTREVATDIQANIPPYRYQPITKPVAANTPQIGYTIQTNPENPSKTIIRLRKALVESAGFKAGEKLAVFTFGSEVLILKSTAKYGFTKPLNYSVGTKGDIRISIPTELVGSKTEEVNTYPHGEIFIEFK